MASTSTIFKICVTHGRVLATKRTKKCPLCGCELDETEHQGGMRAGVQ